MSATKALSGFHPSRKRGAACNSTGSNVYTIASGYASNIFSGDLVTVSSTGVITVYATATEEVLGVFTGVSYEANGEPKWSGYWPASTSATNIKAMVIDDPNQLYIVQADASISAGDVNVLNFRVTTGAGSAVTKRSGFGVDAGSRVDDPLTVRVVGIVDEVGNTASDAYTKVEVMLNQHIDTYVTAGVSAG